MMPIYEYRCKKCGHGFEVLSKMGAKNPSCPQCGRGTYRRFSVTNFSLKGEGWSKDGYAKSEKKGSPR